MSYRPWLFYFAMALPVPAVADTLGFYAGVGQWYTSMEGEVGQFGVKTSLDAIGVEEESINLAWARFEHPIPILPNIGLAYSQLSTRVASTAGYPIYIGRIQIQVQASIITDMDLTMTDAYFYYEILDNALSLDVGLMARDLSGFVKVTPEVGGAFLANLVGTVPLMYAQGRIDFPFSGFFIESTFSGISYQDDEIWDVATKIGYEFDFPFVDMGVDVGYRRLSLYTDNLSNLFADATFSGALVNFSLHF